MACRLFVRCPLTSLKLLRQIYHTRLKVGFRYETMAQIEKLVRKDARDSLVDAIFSGRRLLCGFW